MLIFDNSITRRSFLKVLAGGVSIALAPAIFADKGTDAFQEYQLKLIYREAYPTPSDPYAEFDTIAWKVKGMDNVQYGSYFEYNKENRLFERFLPEWLEEEIAKSMDAIPALNNITRPTKQQITEVLN